MNSATETIRPARVDDVPEISELVNYYAERGRMLHRSHQSVYESLRDFLVAVDGQGKVVGCVAGEVFWSDLAEVKSLAVRPELCGWGIGEHLVKSAVEGFAQLGVTRAFALTYEQEFFQRQGFGPVKRSSLPEKVWRECIACPKVDNCDETAMMRSL